MFYFSLKCYSEDIDKETLHFGTPMYKPTHLVGSLLRLPVPTFKLHKYAPCNYYMKLTIFLENYDSYGTDASKH